MHVLYQTRVKHLLLSGWIKICRDAQTRHKKQFNFIDLYSGDGKAECKDICKKWDKKPTCKCGEVEICEWDGSPLIFAKCATKASYPFKAVFNDINPDTIRNLKTNLNPYMQNVNGIYNKDANEICPDILKTIPKMAHNLFFLDPFSHTQLNWTTVESIANHKIAQTFPYPITRRPELIINCMTYTMQRDYKVHPEYVDNFLGKDVGRVWREKVNEYERRGIPVHKAFLEIYIEKLKALYNEMPFWVEVRKIGEWVSEGPLFYYLIFVSSVPRVNQIFSKFKDDYVEKHRRNKWIRNYFDLKGYSSLDGFLSSE